MLRRVRERCGFCLAQPNLRHHVAYEAVDTARRHHLAATSCAEEEVGIDGQRVIEARIARAKMFEHIRVVAAGLYRRTKRLAGDHAFSFHSFEYSGKRFFSSSCMSLRALNR